MDLLEGGDGWAGRIPAVFADAEFRQFARQIGFPRSGWPADDDPAVLAQERHITAIPSTPNQH